MNVIVLDSFDWANRTGDQTGNENGQSFLYEGVIAHELEHLLMNYSDSGELSWVDEGLADMAAFLNGYPPAGSHFTYHQVFHRETSLTRWGGGLENYGASLSYFLYLWEQAGGNGDGTLDADLEYDGAGGDLLIKLIFAEQADSLEGVQNAIDEFNAQTGFEPSLGHGPVQGLGDRDLPRRPGLGPVRHQECRLRTGLGQLDDPARQRPVLRRPRPVQGRHSERLLPPQQGRPAADGAAVRHQLRDVPQPGSDLQARPRWCR